MADKGIMRLQYWGQVLAPNKLTLKQELERLDQECKEQLHTPLHYLLSFGRAEGDLMHPEAWPGGALPELCAIMGMEPLLQPEFRAQFLMGEGSVALKPDAYGTRFAAAGCQDPEGRLTLYAVSPFVILADKRKLGERPVPHSWEELMDPLYQGEIVTTGKRTPGSIPFFYFYYLFGPKGMEAFGENVKGGTSPVRMALEAGRAESMGGIYILPWFFARCCPRRDQTEIIWPTEGALVYPLLLLAQKNRSPAAQRLADYFMGAKFAKDSAKALVPSLHAESDPCFPPNGKLCFAGWKTLRTMDLERYRQTVGDFSMVPSLREPK